MPTLGWSPALACCLQVAGAPGSGAILAPAPTPGHAHLLCLLGDPLGEPLAGEPLGDPFPWELLLSPLNMVLKAGVGSGWARPVRVGRQRAAGVCPRWLLSWALARWGSQAPGGQFLGGSSLQVRR